jgi:hypothetical protein
MLVRKLTCALPLLPPSGLTFKYAPPLGPSSGGTAVILLVDQKISSGAVLYCKFGDAALPAASMFYDDDKTAVTCTAPPGDPLTEVKLSVSLDGGQTYTEGGYYNYHEALQIYTIAPSGTGTSSPLYPARTVTPPSKTSQLPRHDSAQLQVHRVIVKHNRLFS